MFRFLPRLFSMLVVLALASSTISRVSAQHPQPPGPFARPVDKAKLAKTAFGRKQPIVGTYYFYWYDVKTGEHFVNPDGSDALTDHPADSNDYSYRSANWHQRELGDMLEAGLDFMLPVYWGYPGDYDAWSFVGLRTLVSACRHVERTGRQPPRIGMFYDTSTLQHNRQGFHADLTTAEGRQWLYLSVRDFYSLIPPDLWATIEGQPLVWLYSAAFAKQQDPAALDELRSAFKRDFGCEPFIVKEVSWQGRADASYSWGAALKPSQHGVLAVGPGYDHRAVPGREPLVRAREGGDFYRQSWEWGLGQDAASRPSIAIVETWNEFHEGTEIAPTKEYGRAYLEQTRHYADRWRASGAR
jgi:hypothetical protein